MADNWGATVDTTNYGNTVLGHDDWTPEDAWFNPINYSTSSYTITMLKPMVMNQQPFHISALADQFRNAGLLLKELETNVRAQSEKLYNDAWTDGLARNKFMEKGPGRVLAYLQQWQEVIVKNEQGLRHLLDPITHSQSEMERIWKEYEAAVQQAGDPNNVTGAELNDIWEIYDFNPFNDLQELDNLLLQKVDKVKEKYDQMARDLVQTLAGAYWEGFMTMRDGVGAAYAPPNVIAAAPGSEVPWYMPPTPSMPNLSAAGLNAPNVNAIPQVNVNPQQLQQLQNGLQNVQNLPGQPPNPNLPGLGPNGLPTNPVTNVSNPNLPGQPPLAPGVPPGLGLGPRAMPAGLNAPGLGTMPASRGAVVPNGLNGLSVPPGLGSGLSRGVLGSPRGANGFGALPPPGRGLGKRQGPREGTLRSPAANYTATGGGAGGPGAVPNSLGRTSGAGGRMPPPASGLGSRQPGSRGTGVPSVRAGGLGVPEAFSRGSMPPPVSPVLGRQSRRQARQGTDVPVVPPGQRGAFAPPAATAPVLNAPTARGAGGMPPPSGIPPQRRTRRQQQRMAAAFAALAGGGPGGPNGPALPGPLGALQGTGGGMPFAPGGMPPGRRDTGRYTGRPAPNLVGNPDWLGETGPDEASSTAPVLRNQMVGDPETGTGAGAMLPLQPGATAPVLGGSRAAVRRAMADNRSRPGARQTAPTETELARRTRETEAQEVRPGEEEAFTVQTPGGPVLGSTPARPEEAPRPTIGNA
jgi:hypothetical protein